MFICYHVCRDEGGRWVLVNLPLMILPADTVRGSHVSARKEFVRRG